MKKKIVYATTIMSTIVLISTGFAAWIISGNNEVSNTGTIAVDTVSNASRIISDFKWSDGTDNPKIVFSFPENPNEVHKNQNVYTSVDHSIGYEKLNAKATFEVTNVDNVETLKDIMDIKFSLNNKMVNETEITNFNDAITKGYITGIPVISDSLDGWGSDFITDPDDSDGKAEYGIRLKKSDDSSSSSNKKKFEIEIKFAWGKTFNYENPYYYYNSLESFDGSKAERQLNEMNKLLNGVSYSLKITTKVPNISD